jgi:hypothetical protein
MITKIYFEQNTKTNFVIGFNLQTVYMKKQKKYLQKKTLSKE